MNGFHLDPSPESAAGGTGTLAHAARPAGADGAPGQPEPIASFTIGSGLGVADAQPSKPRMSSSTQLLLGGLFLAGGALVGMRALGIGPGTAFGKVRFDTKLIDEAPRSLGDHAVVLADLNASRVQLQVPGDSIKLNPFEIANVLPISVAPGDDGSRSAEAARAEAERLSRSASEKRRALTDALAGLVVNSIIDGASPAARISGKTVRPGDTVANLFTVKAIKGRTVELVCEGTIYQLELNRGGFTIPDAPAQPAELQPSSSLPPLSQWPGNP
ncbi:MAG: hypothetical protein ACKVS8_07855 [Phycisphaerales bacterium]